MCAREAEIGSGDSGGGHAAGKPTAAAIERFHRFAPSNRHAQGLRRMTHANLLDHSTIDRYILRVTRDSLQRLQEEIKQTKPFQTRAHAAALALLRTADDARRCIDALISPHGVSVEQYNVLRILRGAGEKGLPTLEIAARLLERNPGITRLIDKLEAKELVERVRCKTDRRQVFCRITPAGLQLVGSLDEPSLRQNAEFFRGLDDRHLDQLIDLLDLVRHPDTKSLQIKEKVK
jgi:MarR family transcriptional regulator, organic hydroperoxide resistance regulator